MARSTAGNPSLAEDIAEECHAMVLHALSSGLKVPGGLVHFPKVNGSPDGFSLLKNSGMDLLLNELFLLSAAGIGASFSNLFQANLFVRNGTFDPVY